MTPHYFHCAVQTAWAEDPEGAEGRTVVQVGLHGQGHHATGELATEMAEGGTDTAASSAGGDIDELHGAVGGDDDGIHPMGHMSGERRGEDHGRICHSRSRPRILGTDRPLKMMCMYCRRENAHWSLTCPQPHVKCINARFCQVPFHHPHRGPFCPFPPNPMWRP
jgi:hypothetical protein